MTTVSNHPLCYGNMYADDISQVVTVASANVYYEVPGSLTGGSCSDFTFQSSKQLLCGRAGIYQVTYGISIASATNNEIVSAAVMIDTTEAHNTEGSAENINSGKPIYISGTGIITLAAGNVVKLCVQNETAAHNITVYHANLSIIRIGLEG